MYEGHETGRAHKKVTNYRSSIKRVVELMPPPCNKCPKLRAEDRRNNPNPRKAIEPTDRQIQALHYYRMMKMDRSGTLPYDGLTLMNNSLIAQAEEEAKEVRSSLGSK